MSFKEFMKDGHLPTLVIAFFYFSVTLMAWVLIGVLGSYVAKDFALGAQQKGLMVAIPLLGGSLVRIPIGLFVDRIGAKKTGLLTLGITFIPLLGIWLFVHSFAGLLVFGFLLGIAGGSFAVALPLVSRWYQAKHQGIALGLVGAGTCGAAMANFFGPPLAERWGWQGVFGWMLLPMTLIFILYYFFVQDNSGQPKPKKISEYLSVMKEADALWFCFFYAITFGGFVGLASFLGIFFHDQYGLTKVMAGTLTATCAITGAFLRPVGGYLADRFGGVRVLGILYAVIALLMAAVGFLPPLAVVLSLLFCGMSLLGMGNGVVFQLVPLRFQKEIGITTGLVGAFGGLGAFFLPMLLGGIKEMTGSYQLGFVGFAGISFLALVILNLVQRGWAFTRQPQGCNA